ncbi:MAG TPA: sigma 54-interacting transcriptional regulator, partial [Kofleriaceae bacterium]|nr:sigma 54-interacting transcriptional regulator [Kofleriaceae bacterium]
MENGYADKTTQLALRAEAAQSNRHYLLVFERDLSTRVFQLPANGTVIIGRGDDTALQLRDSSVSRRHARITQVDGRAQLADLESQNGTLINHDRVNEPQPLVSGDQISLGGVTLVYHSSVTREVSPRSDDKARTISLGGRNVVVADPAMARLYELVERLAVSELPVLVCGETGAGKDVVASALHQLSHRNGQPLISLNCAAIQENLVESELFGYERGAFSGAVTAKPGLLETANGGTVFLDEIGDLPLAVQAKLLRVLETKRVLRLGDVRERAIDIRLIAATHRDLGDDVVSGRFRRDLFFRLSGATLWIPPLRDRPRELPLLADMFLRDACRQQRRAAMQLSDATRAQLLAMPWPGNVRELKHLMEYLAAALHDNVIEPHHLEQPARLERMSTEIEVPQAPVKFRPLADEIRELEQSRITAALSAAAGNQRVAAQLLAMPLRTF